MLSSKDQTILRNQILLANTKGSLTETQLEIIVKNNLFNLFVPKIYNGLELDLLQGLQVQEQLASIDGSLGWTVTLCSGANMFVGFLQPEIAKDLFRDKNVCFGGSGKISGKAIKTDTGYKISGKWDVVTGLEHCTVFTANCLIIDNQRPVEVDKGEEIYQSFFFYPHEIQPVKSWDMIGLKATGSHGYIVEELNVDKLRTFSIDKHASFNDNPIYQIPFFVFARFTLAINLLGMRKNFLKQALLYFQGLEHNPFLDKHKKLVHTAEQQLQNHREEFYRLAEDCWSRILKGEEITKEVEQEVIRVCKAVVLTGRDQLMKVAPYLGLELCKKNSNIGIIYTDILTACQHSLFIR
ncbi:acyl-CoA dehydrogenase family protein [Myroides sp. LJL119]